MEDDHVCEKCGKRRATWHLTDFVDGTCRQQHLCDECHAGTEDGARKMDAAFRRLIAAVVPELQEQIVPRCPLCGIDYLEFRQHMQLGCPNDYEAFAEPLGLLLERVHGASQHGGKTPPREGPEAAVHSRVRSLRRQQQRAIAQENYELAAELRDRIGKLEQDGPRPPEG
ncbi:MAG: DNA helicase UvrBC [Candidatus Brocadiaceae bacterium]|nr:DNA helicase UvrBC [Candidatus Brocadiaceae bacterium]